jgi:hypothetical protein
MLLFLVCCGVCALTTVLFVLPYIRSLVARHAELLQRNCHLYHDTMRRRRVLEDIVQCIAHLPGRFLQRTNDDRKSSGCSSWRVLSHNEALAKTKRALQYRAAAAAALARPLCRIRDGGRPHHLGDLEPNDSRDWMVPSALPPERAAAPTTAVGRPAKMVLGTTPPLHHAHHPLATTTTTSTTVETTTTTTTAIVTVDTDSVSLSIVEQPERNDVVLGRGKRYQNHPGNVFFDGTKA